MRVRSAFLATTLSHPWPYFRMPAEDATPWCRGRSMCRRYRTQGPDSLGLAIAKPDQSDRERDRKVVYLLRGDFDQMGVQHDKYLGEHGRGDECAGRGPLADVARPQDME